MGQSIHSCWPNILEPHPHFQHHLHYASCRVGWIGYGMEPSGVSHGSNLRKRHGTDWHLTLPCTCTPAPKCIEVYHHSAQKCAAPDWHLTTFLLCSGADVASGASDLSDSTLVPTLCVCWHIYSCLFVCFSLVCFLLSPVSTSNYFKALGPVSTSNYFEASQTNGFLYNVLHL